MKLKKSHILLIVIAIFLLISIGSACASDNITDDGDIELADDGENVVLSDTDTVGNVPDDTNQEKLGDVDQEKENTTVETDKDTYKFQYDSDKNVSVEVKANTSNVNLNKEDLSLFEGNKTINFELNDTIIEIKEALSVGNHSITINYLGNANYTNSSKIITVQICGNNTIETETTVVCDGKNIEIPVKVHDGVDYIELIKTNFQLTLVYTNESGNVSNLTINNNNFTVEDGKIKFTTPVQLIAASLIIDYANATEPKTVGIKVYSEVNATTNKDRFESEEIKDISITVLDGQGNLINVTKNDLEVFEDGTAVEFTYNNTNITITSISEGAHNLTIVFKGNDMYNSSSANVELNVYGKNQIIVPEYVVSNGTEVEIPITIFNGLENVTLDKTNLTLNITYTNETGNVTTKTLDYDSFDYDSGKIKFNVNGFTLDKASLTIDCINSAEPKTVKINLNTQTNATPDNNKYRFNETNNITVEVSDINGQPLTVSANDFKVFDNGNEIQFTYNNSIMNVNLAEGVHNLTITYKGDETYNSSSTTIELKVYGDLRFDPSKTAVLDESNKATITVNLNDGADLQDIDGTKLNVTIFYTVGNQTFNMTVTPDINGQNISFEIAKDFDAAYVNIKYSENNLTANTTIKVNTEISASDLEFGESEVKNFTVEVKGTNGHIINITQDNIQVLNGGKALNINVTDGVITINDAFKFGVYNLTIKYLGDDTYIQSIKNITLTVYGFNATTSTNVNSSKTGNVKVTLVNGNEKVNITLENLTANVTYVSGNDTIVIPVTLDAYDNGTLTFTLANGNFTKAVLTLKYDQTEVNITLNRIYNVNIEVVNGVNEYQAGDFKFKLVDIDDPETIVPKGTSFTLTTVGNIRAGHTGSTDENGIITYKNANLFEYSQTSTDGSFNLVTKRFDVGNHEVELSTSGSNIKSTTIKVNLTITPAHMKIVIDKFEEYYGTEKNLTFTVTNANTGEVISGAILKLNIPQISSNSYYLSTDSNGIARILVKGIVGGTYSMTVSNNDTKNFANTSTAGSMTIKKLPVVISASGLSIDYNSGDAITVKVTKDGAALEGAYVHIKVYVTSSKFEEIVRQTDKDGKITFTATLAVGSHKLIVSMADNRYDGGEVTKTIKVKKASAKITAKKVTAYYKGGKYFTVKLTNSKSKKPIYNAKINIKVYVSKNRYYNYNGNTGLNGKIKLSLDNLAPGKYKVVVSGADSKSFSAKEVTTKIVIKKAPTKLTAKKVTAKKGAKKYFKVKAKNKKTKKPISKLKLKVKVYTGKKYKTYTIKTNKKGIAKLSVKKLKVGKHKVLVKSADKYCVAKQAKSSIKIKK
jgi:hypothetical protein